MQRKVGVVVQARVGSSRLPAKALRSVEGKPLISRVIERAQQAVRPRVVICALPETSSNDELSLVCAEHGARVFRGSEHDVLSRFVQCCDQFDLTDVVRITGDCPLIDPALIDRFIQDHVTGDWDLTANLVEAAGTFPRGMDVEVVRASALRTLGTLALEGSHREHVTLYFYERQSEFSVNIVPPSPEEIRPDLRLCVDYEEDMELVRAVWGHFAGQQNFSLREIIRFLDDHPELSKINDRYKRAESNLFG